MKTITIEEFLNNYSSKNKQGEINNFSNLFTIMSFITTGASVIRRLNNEGKYSIGNNIGWELKEMLNLKNNNIHSIKRNSDGKVFTLEDIIIIGPFANKKIIKSFIKHNDNMFIKVKDFYANVYNTIELECFLNMF